MSVSSSLTSRAWLPVLLLAGAIVSWLAVMRAQRVRYVSNLPVAAATVDTKSPTGYAEGLRMLVVPEGNVISQEWIVQTQLMLARGDWRLRQVDYDNAPEGRVTHAPAPYRWWLGFVAGIIAWCTDVPDGIAVERAALWADPLLHLALLASVTIFAARRFGNFTACVLALAIALLFPLAGEFAPGQPDRAALTYLSAAWSLLPLVAALQTPTVARRCFLAAGIAGGLGVWIDVTTQVPILIGIGLGGIAATRLRQTAPVAWPWRAWAITGAATSCLAYLVEYFPSHLDVMAWRLQVNHPLYALAWLGAGELLARFAGRHRGAPAAAEAGKPSWSRGTIVIVSFSALAVLAVPAVLLLTSTRGFLAAALLSPQLSKLPDGPVAGHIFEWLKYDGIGGVLAAIGVPLVVTGAALWFVTRRNLAPAGRASLALALGPVAVALGFACLRLQWWSFADSVLLALLAGLPGALGADATTSFRRTAFVVLLAVAALPGLRQLATATPRGEALSEAEAQAVLERDLAHWLTRQTGGDGPIVVAPPALTSALIYYGSARGVSTPYWENVDGFNATLRIAGTASLAEAESLLRRRSVTHVLTPSWNNDLDEYARLTTTDTAATIAALLRRWAPPRWLRPVPYQVPRMPGFEGRTVGVFALVDVQEDVTALSRLAECFIETGRLEFAAQVSQTIREKYPADLGGLVAQGQVAAALRDTAAFATTLQSLLDGIKRGDDLGLPWDRRVNLAILLAFGNQPELAKAQLQRSFKAMDEAQLRSLTTLTLFNLQMLAKRLGEEIPDPQLRALALRLLPPDRRERLR